MPRVMTLVFATILTITLYAHSGETPRTAQQVAGRVWVYGGATPMTPSNSYGANAGIIVGDREVMVVDTLASAKEGQRLLEEVRNITPLPIRWVVNTHYHFDHSGGNCVFAKAGATVVAAAGGQTHLAERNSVYLAHPEQVGMTADEMAGTELAPATLMFKDRLEIDLGGVRVELRTLPHGHCSDNLLVWLPENRIVFAGDLLFTGCHPFVGEGNFAQWRQSLDAIAERAPDKIVPGHGRVSTVQDVQQMGAYLEAFGRLGAELTKGKTVEELPAIAQEMVKRLPEQGRMDLPGMVEFSLRMKYFPPQGR